MLNNLYILASKTRTFKDCKILHSKRWALTKKQWLYEIFTHSIMGNTYKSTNVFQKPTFSLNLNKALCCY